MKKKLGKTSIRFPLSYVHGFTVGKSHREEKKETLIINLMKGFEIENLMSGIENSSYFNFRLILLNFNYK